MAQASQLSSCYSPKPMMQQELPDGGMYFSIMKHPREVLEVLQSLRLANKLCDVSLLAGAEELRAHKVVLASSSPYFRAMFAGGMREERMPSVSLQGIPSSSLATLVNFAYTSEIVISESNVSGLLPAATMLQMIHVVDACSVFLENRLDSNNCIGIADFAAMHGCLDLEEKARTFIRKHFCDVIQSEEFLMLSYDQVQLLLSQEELNVKCESEVYKSIIRWVSHSTEDRVCKMDSLLCGVRLANLSPGFLEQQLKNCPILNSRPGCMRTLIEQLKRLQLHKEGGDRPRKPCSQEVVYCVGGYMRQSISNFECYNPRTQQWHRLPDLPTPLCGLSAVILQGALYVVGGRVNTLEGSRDSSSLIMYEAHRNAWVPRCPMSVPRSRGGVGVIDNMIYAVGGSQGHTQHHSAER